MNVLEIPRGSRVRVTQEIDHRNERWKTAVEGTVEWVGYAPTGSWYAHGKNDRLWVLRMRLRKDDGEVTTLNLDSHTKVTLVEPAPAGR